MLPVIVVNSRLPGLLLVNGVNAGEVDEDRYVSLPLNSSGTCYLHYLPAQTGTEHCAVRFFIEEGVLTPAPKTDAPVTLVRWPGGVHEICFYPAAKAAPPAALAPVALSTLAVNGVRFALLQYGGLWLAAERGEDTLLAHALPQEAQSGALQALGEGVCALGSTQNGQWGAVYLPAGQGWQQAVYLQGDEVTARADGTLHAREALHDAAQHLRQSSWHAQSGLHSTLRSTARPHGGEAVARAFLQACALNLYGEAEEYLSAPLRGQINGEALKSFIGEVYTCMPAKYGPAPAAGQTAMALLRKTGDRTLQACPLAFTLAEEAGEQKIDDIRPL